MANPSLALIPSGYKVSKIYSVLPEDGTGDGTFVRAGEKTRVNESGLIETLAANVPSIDYTDGGCPVLLLEPQQTQLYELTDVMATQVKTTLADEYTVGFYGTGTITFSGTFVGSLVGTGVNDRVEITFTATAGSLTSTVTGSVTKSQLVLGDYLGSYIPNAGVGTVTRLADVATDFGDVNTFNSLEGVLFFNLKSTRNKLNFSAVQLSDGSDVNRISIFPDLASNGWRVQIYANSIIVLNLLIATDITIYGKIAVQWKSGDWRVFFNGIEEISVADLNIFTDLNVLNLGFWWTNTYSFKGCVKSFSNYYNIADAGDLATLTTL